MCSCVKDSLVLKYIYVILNVILIKYITCKMVTVGLFLLQMMRDMRQSKIFLTYRYTLDTYHDTFRVQLLNSIIKTLLFSSCAWIHMIHGFMFYITWYQNRSGLNSSNQIKIWHGITATKLHLTYAHHGQCYSCSHNFHKRKHVFGHLRFQHF